MGIEEVMTKGIRLKDTLNGKKRQLRSIFAVDARILRHCGVRQSDEEEQSDPRCGYHHSHIHTRSVRAFQHWDNGGAEFFLFFLQGSIAPCLLCSHATTSTANKGASFMKPSAAAPTETGHSNRSLFSKSFKRSLPLNSFLLQS